MTKHGWVLFVVIGGVGLAMSVGTLFDPGVLLRALAEVDPLSSTGAAAATPFFARWTATALFGVNGITILIACTAFRRGERWAGVALSYWPLMFLSHLLMYRWGPMSFVQLGWLLVSVPTLVLHFRRSRAGSPSLTLSSETGRLA